MRHQISAGIASIADDLRGRIAFQKDVLHGNAWIDGPDLLQLVAPVVAGGVPG